MIIDAPFPGEFGLKMGMDFVLGWCSTSGVKSLLIYATGLICMRHLEYFSCMSRMGFCLSDAAVYFQPS